MGDPCQVDRVVAGMRPFRQRFSQMLSDTRTAARAIKSGNNIAGSLADIANAFADFIDATQDEVTKEAWRSRQFVTESQKIKADEAKQIAQTWIQHFAEETRHMSKEDRMRFSEELFLWKELKTETPPAKLVSQAPNTVASFMAARKFLNDIGRERVKRGMLVSDPKPAYGVPTSVRDLETGEIVNKKPGEVSDIEIEWSQDIFDAHNGMYFTRLWRQDSDAGINNAPLASKGKLPTNKTVKSTRRRKVERIIEDADAAKLSAEYKKENGIWGLSEAKEAGLVTDLIETFIAEAPAQLHYVAIDKWAEVANVNFARSFKTAKEAHEAGYAKVEMVTVLSNRVAQTMKKGAPPNLKYLGQGDVYIQKDIAAEMNAMLEAKSVAMTINDDVMNMFKAAKTIFNPGYHTHNWGSMALMLSWTPYYSLAGQTGQKSAISVFGEGRKSYHSAKAGDAKEKAYLDEAIKMGVFQPSQSRAAFAGKTEYESLMETTLSEMGSVDSYSGYLNKLNAGIKKLTQLTLETGDEKNTRQKLKAAIDSGSDIATGKVKDFQDWLTLASSMSDQYFRYGMYRDLRDRLKMTPEQAANEVDKTTVRYDTLPNFAKQINRFSVFYSFNHAMARVVTARIADGIRATVRVGRGEITPKEAWREVLPVIKMFGTLGILGAINETVLASRGFTEEERDLWKNSTPSIDFDFAGLDWLPASTGLETPAGKLNLTYSIPIPFGDVLFGHTIGEPLAYEGFQDSLSNTLGASLQTIFASNPAISSIGETMAFEDFFTGQPLARGENILTAGEKFWAMGAHIGAKFMPYVVLNSYKYLMERQIENVSRTGAKRDLPAFAGAFLGFPLANWNIEEAQARANIQLKSRINAIDEEIRKLQFDAARKKISREDAVAQMRKQLERRRALILGHPKASKETLSKAKEARLAAAGNG